MHEKYNIFINFFLKNTVVFIDIILVRLKNDIHKIQKKRKVSLILTPFFQ